MERRIPVITNYTNHTINSYGIILFAKKEKSWLIVQRKHSYQFILILKGVYRPTYIHIYCPKLHHREIKCIYKILQLGIPYLKKLYTKLQIPNIYLQSAMLFFADYSDIFLQVLPRCVGVELSWTFPKGRGEYYESNENTARREFSEETNLAIPDDMQYLTRNYLQDQNDSLFNCSFVNNYKIACIPQETTLHLDANNLEVANCIWIKDKELDKYNVFNNKKLLTTIRKYIQ